MWALGAGGDQAGTSQLLQSETELLTLGYRKVMNHQRKIMGVACTVIAVSGEWTFLATKRHLIKKGLSG